MRSVWNRESGRVGGAEPVAAVLEGAAGGYRLGLPAGVGARATLLDAVVAVRGGAELISER